MNYQSKGQGILVDNDVLADLGKIDGIIFDCDGVLVDVSKSYDLAIKETTKFVLKKFVNLESIPITTEIIDGFKATGGFNDEVDVTFASILSLIAANKSRKDAKKFIFDVIDNADNTGIESVEKFLDTLKIDLTDIKAKLDYPGPHTINPLYQIFDQIFYGPELYQKIFGKKSQFEKTGFIENDKVILTKELLVTLKKKFENKLAIVTGRGKESIRYSLKEMLDEFNLTASVFLEDEPRELAKPNPKSLLTSIERLGANYCLYVGDSMEDLMMANKAAQMGKKTIFCGIYGTSKNQESKIRFFEKNKAQIIVKSINSLPKALNLAK